MKLNIRQVNATKSYVVTDVCTTKPRIAAQSGNSVSYLPLTTSTTHGLAFRAKVNNKNYRALEFRSMSTSATYYTTNANSTGMSSVTALTRASTSQTSYLTRSSTSGTSYLTRSSTSGTSYLTKTIDKTFMFLSTYSNQYSNPDDWSNYGYSTVTAMTSGSFYTTKTNRQWISYGDYTLTLGEVVVSTNGSSGIDNYNTTRFRYTTYITRQYSSYLTSGINSRSGVTSGTNYEGMPEHPAAFAFFKENGLPRPYIYPINGSSSIQTDRLYGGGVVSNVVSNNSMISLTYSATYHAYDDMYSAGNRGSSCGTTVIDFRDKSTTGTSYLTRASTSATSYLTRSSTSYTSYLTRSSTSGYSGVSSSSSQSSGWQ